MSDEPSSEQPIESQPPDEAALPEAALPEAALPEAALPKSGLSKAGPPEPGPVSPAPTPPAPTPPRLDERVSCPACGERIPPFAAQCRYCDEYLVPASRVRERSELRASLAVGLFSGCGLLLSLLVVAGVASYAAFPALQRLQHRGHERAAVTALRSLAQAEARLRGGPEQPGLGTYGDLSALSRAQLIDREMAAGAKDGYWFAVSVSDVAPAERWIAIASPLDGGRAGERWFAINHSGAVYALTRPFPLDAQTCEVPADAVPVGEGEWE